MVGTKRNTFLYAFPPQKTVKSSSDGRAHHHNRSSVVELVGREPLIIARVENGVTKLSPQKDRKRQNFQKKIGSGTAVFSGDFSCFGCGKTT